MKFLARLMMIAVFAASSVSAAAGPAGMASETLAANVALPVLTDCTACDDGTAGTTGIPCDFICNPVAAMLTEESAGNGPFLVSRVHDIPVKRDFRGLTSPPAEQPPRLFL